MFTTAVPLILYNRCHPTCATCDGFSYNDCLSCTVEYYLNYGECKPYCRDGKSEFYWIGNHEFINVLWSNKISQKSGTFNFHFSTCLFTSIGELCTFYRKHRWSWAICSKDMSSGAKMVRNKFALFSYISQSHYSWLLTGFAFICHKYTVPLGMVD